MLQDSLFESEGRNKTRKPITVVVSAIAHTGAILALSAIPLFQTAALTIPPMTPSLVLPKFDTRQSLDVFTPRQSIPSRTSTDLNAPPFLTAPPSIPSQIITVDAPPTIDFGPLAGTGGQVLPFFPAVVGNSIAGVERPAIAPALPTPPPLPPPAVQSKPYRVGGEVQAAKLIRQVNPVYPLLARQARIQGLVALEAVIDKDGSIDSLRAISGHLLLTQAALDAVKQWKYSPTMLNGEPVEVITTVTITFTLR